MNVFESLYHNILLEKTFPHELYHYTGLRNVAQMVKTDQIMLSFANIQGSDRNVNEGKFFYLSLSYDKWGRYAGGSSDSRYKSNLNGPQVTLVFDTDALHSKGKLIDVDYWGGDYKDSEKEVRFISDTQALPNFSKYVTSVHVYIPQTNKRTTLFGDERMDHPNLHEFDIRAINRLEDSNIPTFFYDNANAFKLLLTKTASPTFSSKMPKEINSYTRSSRPARDRNALNDLTLSNLLHYFETKEVPANDRWNSIQRLKDTIDNGLHLHDAKATIENDLHNGKTSHSKVYQDIVNFFKKNRINDLDELIQFLKT